MKNKYWIIFIGAMVISGLQACSKKSSHDMVSSKALYHCAMHPQIISDKPGECPICHMALIPFQKNASERKILFYRNPMDPSVTSPVPMKDSMGMNYLPVYVEEGAPLSGVSGQRTIN